MKNTAKVPQCTKPILLLIDSETKTATRVVDGKLEQQVPEIFSNLFDIYYFLYIYRYHR